MPCHSESAILIGGRRIPAVSLNGQAINVACAPVSLEFHARPVRDETVVKMISDPRPPTPETWHLLHFAFYSLNIPQFGAASKAGVDRHKPFMLQAK
jgi:hypothetical protein